MLKCLTCGGHHIGMKDGSMYDVFIWQDCGEVRAFICNECYDLYPQMKAMKVVSPPIVASPSPASAGGVK